MRANRYNYSVHVDSAVSGDIDTVFVLFADVGEFWWTMLGLIVLPVLIALNGIFVAVEFALVAVRKTRIEEMAARGVKGAKAVQAAMDPISRSIAATQLGITLCSIGLGWVAEQGLAQLFDWMFEALPPPWNKIATHSLATALAFILLTFCHVVFGELVPKSMALQSPDRFALWLAGPLNWFVVLTRPHHPVHQCDRRVGFEARRL